MAKREFIDRQRILSECFCEDIPCDECKFRNHNGISGCFFYRQLGQFPRLAEREIVKPYLEDILDEINLLNSSGGFTDYNNYCHIFDFVDNLLSESEG